MGHIHEHEHAHNHIHVGGEHTHDHYHAHSHDHSESAYAEVKALLEYIIHHNEHHNEELANLLDQLPVTAQKKLTIAIGSFEAANVELKGVLDCL